MGVMALAKALEREGRSKEEKAFLIAELALELARARPRQAPGCLPPEQVCREIQDLVIELRNLVPSTTLRKKDSLSKYVKTVFESILK